MNMRSHHDSHGGCNIKAQQSDNGGAGIHLGPSTEATMLKPNAHLTMATITQRITWQATEAGVAKVTDSIVTIEALGSLLYCYRVTYKGVREVEDHTTSVG